jgi:protein-S-isoprenylcysteine O-methyltransferase Ste14
MLTVLAIAAIFPAVATPIFFLFWCWFDFWRRHRAAIVTVLLGIVGSWTAALILWHGLILAPSLVMPWPLQVLGWIIGAASFVLSVVADRQLGLRIRSGLPFFEQGAPKIKLRTRGAYGIVRHPIYAAGIYYQLAMFLVTGDLAIAAACAVLTLGALWFTRQEEQRLVSLLEDPAEYDRYRARVGALLPRLRRR